MLACIADVPVETRYGPLPIAVSIGVGYLEGTDTDVYTLLARADQELYRAKQDGRNCVRGM